MFYLIVAQVANDYKIIFAPKETNHKIFPQRLFLLNFQFFDVFDTHFMKVAFYESCINCYQTLRIYNIYNTVPDTEWQGHFCYSATQSPSTRKTAPRKQHHENTTKNKLWIGFSLVLVLSCFMPTNWYLASCPQIDMFSNRTRLEDAFYLLKH